MCYTLLLKIKIFEVMLRILVVGTGYVGLVTGSCFAEMGHNVTCLDIDKEKIANLQNGIIPIYEPGLEELVKRNAKAGRINFTSEYGEALKNSLVIFLAVPTPQDQDGSCDLQYVIKAAKQIANIMDSYKVIVNKSTVPVGTANLVKKAIQETLDERQSDIIFDIVSNPEFLKEGDAINDFMKPDRIVLGVENADVEAIMKELYSPFNLNHDRILIMDVLSSEMTKYAANAMLATRISFMNELSGLCEIVGADINKIRKGIGLDKRIGRDFLYAGIGYGGSCFPKDIKALQKTGLENNYSMELIDSVDKVNERQKRVLGKKIYNYFEAKDGIDCKTIAIWGLAFKPGTDDLREAPAFLLIEELAQYNIKLKLFDPIAMEKAKSLPIIQKNLDKIIFCENEKDAAQDADAIALVTEWKQFRFLDFSLIIKKMKGNAFFDGRNQYIRQEMSSKGFDYISIGQPISYA
jgi:UDPglucose 6-dehydrogenase